MGEQRAADGVVCLQDQEEVLQGTQEEANGPDQEAEEEEEGGSRQREARCGKTHLRNMVIVPEMTGSIVGVYNGKVFTQVEVKPEMIGHYLGEFSISCKPVKHGRPGIGATHS